MKYIKQFIQAWKQSTLPWYQIVRRAIAFPFMWAMLGMTYVVILVGFGKDAADNFWFYI